MARLPFQNRRTATSGATNRPAIGSDQYNSMLRSAANYVARPLLSDERYLIAEPNGYSAITVSFTPSSIPVVGSTGVIPAGGELLGWCVTRSTAGTPVTPLDGVRLGVYDFVNGKVSNKQITANVASLTTTNASSFTVGQEIMVQIGDAAFDGIWTVTDNSGGIVKYAVPTTTVASSGASGVVAVNIPQVVINDRGLIGAQWYTYGLFVNYTVLGNTYWDLVSVSRTILPEQFEHTEKLWLRIPEWYRRLDDEQRGNTTTPGPLRRFVETLGYEADLHRTMALTLGDRWDVARTPPQLLSALGETLGAPYEAASGDKRYRRYLSNAIYWRLVKGTKEGIEGVMSALTGYRCIAYSGKNLLLTNNDADQRSTIGNWQANGASQALTRNTSAAGSGEPPNGAFYARITSSGATTLGVKYSGVTIGSNTGFDVNAAIPVVAGHLYKTTVAGWANVASKTATPSISWYKTDKTFISTTAGAGNAITSAGVTGTLGAVGTIMDSGWLTAPAEAAYAIPSWSIPSVTSGNYVNLYQFMFIDQAWRYEGVPGKATTLPDTTYESARKVHVNLYPNRVNLAINSGFALSTEPDGWAALEPTIYASLPAAYATYADIVAPVPNRTITTKALTSNVATLTTSVTHGFNVGSTVIITGVDATFNGTYTILSVPTSTTFTYAKTAADVGSTASGGTASQALTVTNKALTSNVATITTSVAHGFAVGQGVVVAGVDATFNGTYGITAVTSTTFSYAKTAANVSSTASGGTATPTIEATYADLAAGYDALSATATYAIDTTNKWLTMSSASTTAPRTAQVFTDMFPVFASTPYSASLEMTAVSPTGTTSAQVWFQWFTANDVSTRISETAKRATPTTFTSSNNGWKQVSITSVTPPANAAYGRMIVETFVDNNAAHSERIRKVIIEDRPVAGSYFDGTFTDGGPGDYQFVGTMHQSISVYHLNYGPMLSQSYNPTTGAGTGRAMTLLAELVPPERDSVIHAMGGLL